MQLIIKEKNKMRINRAIDWLLYMLGYTVVFLLVSSIFPSIVIDKNNYFLWVILIELLVYIFNKTIKPILVTLTIPITGITLGLFYPFINVFILKLVDFILGKHFEVRNLLVAFVAAVLISIMNFIMEEIIKIIIKKVKKNGKNSN